LSDIFCQVFVSKGFPKVFLIFLIVVLRIQTKEALFFVSFLYIFSARKDKEKIQKLSIPSKN